MADNNKSFKKQTFLQGAAVLAAATAIVKVIGAIYSIPLANIIGDEGFSYFNKAYQIYEVLLMISTTGLPVAMSRMISEAQALERHDQVRKIFSTALRVFLLLGILFSMPLARNMNAYLHSHPSSAMGRCLTLLYPVGLAALLLVSVCYLMSGTYNPFIYFNF